MNHSQNRLLPWLLGAAAAAALAIALLGPAGGVLGMAVVLAGAVTAVVRRFREPQGLSAPAVPRTAPSRGAAAVRPAPSSDAGSFVREMLAQGRYSLLLRRQIASNLTEEQLRQTVDMLTAEMSLLPEGEVEIQHPDFGDAFDDMFDSYDAGVPAVYRIGTAFVDRYLVRNRDYARFVAAGGYESMAIWDQEIWPAVLEFVDATGHPGPRFWRNGRCPAGQEDHPVTGICWFEAQAYARWVGKRLLTDAEWVKSAAWPVSLSPTSRVQRRFPWGDEMDRGRANLWNEGIGHTLPVDHFPLGVSTGGLYQLVGNVWEWTSSDFRPDASPFGRLTVATPMKVIRGGAFDTYFENQADCRFQSAENPVARKHNIGFRCAISASDVTMQRPADPVAAADRSASSGSPAPQTEAVLS